MKCRNCGAEVEYIKCNYCGTSNRNGFVEKIDPMKLLASEKSYLSMGWKTVDEVKKERGSYESLDGTDFSNGGIIAQLGSGEKLVSFNTSHIIGHRVNMESGERVPINKLPSRPKMKLKNRRFKLRNIFKPSIKAFEEFEKAMKQIKGTIK